MRINILLLVFVAIMIMPATSKAEDPTAAATTTNVTAAGGTLYSFTVFYDDDGEIDVSTIGNNDVRITGPGGFSVAAAFVRVNGTIATYSIVPPGGSWDFADNGTYSVVMQANAVFDGIGNPVAAGNIGSFRVMTTTSTPSSLLNISTRMRVQTGQNVMIGGFIITGNASKKVIIRAIGPSLAQAGITGVLANPVLELHGSNGSLITSNDNWKDTQQAAIQATGVPPKNDLESAIVATIAPGRYTAIVTGKNATSGVGLVEVYDLNPAAASKLVNVSSRGSVQTGSNVMIGGFILGGGTGAAKIIVRAIGPSLSQGGISGALANPTLELRNAHGILIRSNDNWKDTQQTEIQASGVPPKNDLESALVATLSPGSYTAIVAGKSSGTGVAFGRSVPASVVARSAHALENFNTTKGKPRTAAVERAAQTTSLPNLIREGSDLLGNQIDRLVNLVRRSNSQFVAGYRSARVIIEE